MHRPVWLFAAAAIAVTLPAFAQRAAVSADLSPEAAGQAFRRAVVEGCVPAVTGLGLSAVAAAQQGQLQPTQDAETRRQSGAGADETVWDVAEARGVVMIREKAGRCVASVYGPASAPTIMNVAQALSTAGFEPMVGPASPSGGFTQTLVGARGGRRVTVQLSGAEPGAPGNQSKFSVVTATVFAAQ
jgi:hypothetical protein